MNDDIEAMKYNVTFKVEHPEYGTYVRKVDIDDSAAWSDHLTEYLDFLGSVYGYSIREKVAIDGMVWGKWTTDGHPTFDDIRESNKDE